MLEIFSSSELWEFYNDLMWGAECVKTEVQIWKTNFHQRYRKTYIYTFIYLNIYKDFSDCTIHTHRDLSPDIWHRWTVYTYTPGTECQRQKLVSEVLHSCLSQWPFLAWISHRESSLICGARVLDVEWKVRHYWQEAVTGHCLCIRKFTGQQSVMALSEDITALVSRI